MATMQFTADPTSPSELDAVIAAAKAVRGSIGSDAVGPPEPGSVATAEDLAEQVVLGLMSRIGQKITTMLVAEAELSEKADYTMAQLAKEIGQTPIQVRSHRGNLGRSLLRVRRTVKGAPDLYVWKQDRCRMTEPVRKAVLKHMKPTS
jgi:hypothetical protein